MIMTLGASDGQAQQRRRHDFDCLRDDFVFRQFGIVRTTACPVGSHAQKSGCNQFREMFLRQFCVRRLDHFVAGQLLTDEFVKWPVGVD